MRWSVNAATHGEWSGVTGICFYWPIMSIYFNGCFSWMTPFLCFPLFFVVSVFTLFSSWNVFFFLFSFLLLQHSYSVQGLLCTSLLSSDLWIPILTFILWCHWVKTTWTCVLNLHLPIVIIFLHFSSYSGIRTTPLPLFGIPSVCPLKNLLFYLPLSYIFKPDFSTSSFRYHFNMINFTYI